MLRRLLLLLLIVIGMSGCTTVWANDGPDQTGTSPEDAVFAWMKQQPSGVGNTLAIRQVIELEQGRAPVLATYYPEDWTYALPALALFIVERKDGQWVTTDPYYSGYPELINQVLTYYDLSEEEDIKISAVYGLVVEENATHVDVVWDDDREEAVKVVNGSYLSIRTDKPGAQGLRVVARDNAGNVLAELSEP